MKPKRSMKNRTCNECGTDIQKGDQYAQRSKRCGDTGIVSYDGTVKDWDPYYVKVDICNNCANGKQGVKQCSSKN